MQSQDSKSQLPTSELASSSVNNDCHVTPVGDCGDGQHAEEQ